MKLFAILFILTLFTTCAFAGDFHNDDETHTVVYTIADDSGNHVSGQTVRLTVKSSDTANYYNFTNNTWAAFAGTDSHATMTEDANGGFYFYTITIDSATLASGDIVTIVSNDDATYADLQAESITFSNLNNLIKINR